MNTKVKGKNLKLGDVLYVANEWDLESGVQRVLVTSLVLNKDGEIGFHINNQSSQFYQNQWHLYVTRSENKAVKVHTIWLEQKQKRDLRYKKQIETLKENENNLVEVSKRYVGKTVMVKFHRHEKDTGYEKSVIHSLRPTYKKGEYLFYTSPSTNAYLTSREGKNWYFWTELDELKQKKAIIEKRIEELEK